MVRRNSSGRSGAHGAARNARRDGPVALMARPALCLLLLPLEGRDLASIPARLPAPGYTPKRAAGIGVACRFQSEPFPNFLPVTSNEDRERSNLLSSPRRRTPHPVTNI